MLHILLLILKVLGIVLLAVLGLVLCLLLLVLFVPVRYGLDGEKGEIFEGTILVSWLLHFLTGRVIVDGNEKTAVLKVKILIFKVFEKQLFPFAEDEKEETDGEAEDLKKGSETGAAGEGLPEAVKQVDPDESESAHETPEDLMDEELHTAEISGSGNSRDEEQNKEKEPQKEASQNTPDNGAPEPEKEDADQKQDLKEKIFGIFKAIREKYSSVRKMIDKARAFWNDEENRKAVKLLFTQVKKMLKHLLPRKITGRVRFGFSDPYNTGQVLCAVSPFYALYAKTFVLEPVFDEEVVEGEIHIKGHIRLATLIWIAVRLLLNRNFRKILKGFLK